MKELFKTIVIIVLVLVGGMAGYALGDAILNYSSFVTGVDIVKFRIGMPFFGGLLFLFIAFALLD